MFSNKLIYYYFCLFVAIIMFLIVIGVGGVCYYIDGNLNDAMPLIKKFSIVGSLFLIPPILYKIFVSKAAEEAEEKKEEEKRKSRPITWFDIYWWLSGRD